MPSLLNKSRFFLYLLLLTSFFSLALLLQEKNVFEDGTYTQFTLSIIEDGDFNLINQVKDPLQNWLVTQTGNHPNYEHPAVSIYLFPFLAYQKYLTNSHDFTQGHILATLFYIFIGMILLKRCLAFFRITYINESIMVLALSTPFIWFTFMASTTTNIFSLVYSIVILTAFCLTPNKGNFTQYFFLGLATGLGFAIRIQQFWIFTLFIYLLLTDKESRIKKTLTYLAGLAVPLSLFITNLYLRNGQLVHPHRIYTSWTRFGEFWDSTLPYALWGPNGYFTLSPIYLVILATGTLLLFKNFKDRNLIIFLILPPTALFLYYSTQWPLMDSLAGRHQLDYFFLFTIIIGLALDQASKQKHLQVGLWTLIILSIIWNLRTHVAYYYIDNTNGDSWQFSYFVSPHFLSEQLLAIPSLLNPFSNILPVLKFLPLIFFLAIFICLFERLSEKGIVIFCSYFLLWGISFYFLFTQLNLYNNPKNVESYRLAGVYLDKVITSGDAATFYDDFIETHHKALKWHLQKNDCKTIKRLLEIKENFIRVVKKEITHDPVGFVKDLESGKLRLSYLEGQDLSSIYSDLKIKCNL